MTRLAALEAHVASMAELRALVGAMRALAGMRRQEAQRALPGVQRYAAAMAEAIGDALLLAPAAAAHDAGRDARAGALVLFLAEHGFVGGFNERLIAAAQARRRPGDVLLALGGRGAAQAAEHGLTPDWTAPAPTRDAGAPDAARGVAAELYRRIAGGRIARVDVMHAAARPGGATAIVCRPLLPLPLAALRVDGGRQPPLHTLPPAALLESLVAEYVFALLTEAAVAAVAAENATRFAAMDSAHDNVSRRLDALRGEAQAARQDEITTELLDLVTGAQAQAPGGG